jgi:hypothetical protein
MIALSTLILACGEGLRHSFETDHLAAVANLVTVRNKPMLAVKDGIAWGLGHTLSIMAVGALIIGFKWVVPEFHFSYLEAAVGAMILLLGVYRLYAIVKPSHSERKPHTHDHGHKLALGVGIIHGLAGSGAVVAGSLMVLDLGAALVFVLLFGAGSIIGMLIAAGLLSLPFSKNLNSIKPLQIALTVVSSLFCLYVGGSILYENLLN